MALQHLLLAVFVTTIWGFNFVVIELGLQTTPPLLLGFYRFLLSSLAVFIFVRPQVSWWTILVLSLTMFVGQFAFVFLSLSLGTPPGLTSVVIQSQLIFTLIYVAILERKLPKLPTLLGSLVALVGLFLICLGVGAGKDLSVLGLGLLFLAAAGWGMGNVVLGRLGKIDLAGIVAWMSLAAVVPFGLLSLIFEGPTVILASFYQFDWTTVVSVLVISVLATVIAYGGWAFLIRHYGVVEVSPYSLLVPVSGVLSAVIILGERMDGMRASGIVLILAGLGVHSLWGRFRKA